MVVLAGIVVAIVFSALGLVLHGLRPPIAIEHARIIWNYTNRLDVAAAVFAAWLLFLHFRSRNQELARTHHWWEGDALRSRGN